MHFDTVHHVDGEVHLVRRGDASKTVHKGKMRKDGKLNADIGGRKVHLYGSEHYYKP